MKNNNSQELGHSHILVSIITWKYHNNLLIICMKYLHLNSKYQSYIEITNLNNVVHITAKLIMNTKLV